MGLQFRKSITLCKGVKLNVTKTGVGVTVGKKGCHCSINSSGRTTASVGLPGTGLYYTKSKNLKTLKKEIDKKKEKKAKEAEKEAAKKEKEAAKEAAIAAGAAKRDEKEKEREEAVAAKEAEAQENAEKVEEYEEYLDAIRKIHTECEPVIDWESLTGDNPPFESGTIGPNESKALDVYNQFKPSFMDKLLHGDENDAKKKALQDAVTEAKKLDMELLENWEEMKGFAAEIKKGNIDAYLDVIEEANPFEEMLDFGSDFQFGTESPDRMEIEFRVKSDTVVPKESVSLSKSGQLVVKELTKTQYYDITQDYVCSCAIRLAREIFAMLPVQYVYIHAEDKMLNTATGHEEEMDILSVAFEREKFHAANFELIDPSDFICSFPHNMSFKKTAGFSPIERLK